MKTALSGGELIHSSNWPKSLPSQQAEQLRVVRQIRHQLRGPPCVAWPVACQKGKFLVKVEENVDQVSLNFQSNFLTPFLSAPRLGSSRAWATGPSLFNVPARGVRLLRSNRDVPHSNVHLRHLVFFLDGNVNVRLQTRSRQ